MKLQTSDSISPSFTTVTPPATSRAGSSRMVSISRDFLISALARRGAVLFRGFACSVDDFSKFVEGSSTRTAIDPAREFFAKHIQLVDAGVDEIGLHCENGNTPILPDVVWFFCARAAERGSQTTVCDGFSVWERLSKPTRWLFERHQVKYSRNVEEALWEKYVRHHFAGLDANEQINQERLSEMFCQVKGVQVRINEDRSLKLEVVLPMVHPTRFSSQIAFANSLLGPSYNYERPTISLEDGTEIPEWAIEEVQRVTEAQTHEVPWQSGDVIAIDNTRVMHGRRRILDPERKLYTALSFI